MLRTQCFMEVTETPNGRPANLTSRYGQLIVSLFRLTNRQRVCPMENSILILFFCTFLCPLSVSLENEL